MIIEEETFIAHKANQVSFPIPFPFLQQDDIKVYRNDVLQTPYTAYSIEELDYFNADVIAANVLMAVGIDAGDEIRVVHDIQEGIIATSSPGDMTRVESNIDKIQSILNNRITNQPNDLAVNPSSLWVNLVTVVNGTVLYENDFLKIIMQDKTTFTLRFENKLNRNLNYFSLYTDYTMVGASIAPVSVADIVHNATGTNLYRYSFCADEVDITSINAGPFTQIITTIAHNMSTGDKVILKNTGTVPDLDGEHVITNLGTNALSVPQQINTGTILQGEALPIKHVKTQEIYVVFTVSLSMLLLVREFDV